MKTISTESDFLIKVYPWKTPYIDSDLKEGDPFIFDNGPHFVSFFRSKNIGGTMQIDTFGSEQFMEIGDWVVLKTKSSGKIDRSKYTKDGIIQFIGQVYSKNTSHFADAEGILRTTTQYTVREWSHVFHIQVKVDQTAISLARQGASRSEVLSEAAASGAGGDQSKALLNFVNAKFSPFDMAFQLLQFVGGLSANDDRAPVAGSELLKVTTRLPILPSKLIEENIFLYTGQGSGKTVKFNKSSPWATGFMTPIIGVQKWKSIGKEYSAVFGGNQSIFSDVDLKTDTRPINLYNPLIFGNGWSFIEALTKTFADSGIYEYYTDLISVQTDEFSKTAPAIFARDVPMSFKNLWKSSEAKNIEGKFEWTYLDDIPRTTIDSASVVSLTFNSKASSSANHIRFNFRPGAYSANETKGSATVKGTYVNVPAQRKFGSVVDERDISAFIDPKSIRSNNSNGMEKKEAQATSTQWFQALSNKAGNFYPYLFMFPSANLVIKQSDYPITVGMAVRIELQEITVVGFVESINTTYRVQGDGKKQNSTYLELSLLSMEKQDKTLMPIPSKAISSLFRYKLREEDIAEIEESWVFGSGGFNFKE